MLQMDIDVMMPQNEVWELLRETEEELHDMSDADEPSANNLRQQFRELRRRLYDAEPAGKGETQMRLRKLQHGCAGPFAKLRPAVDKALEVAKQRDVW